MKEHTNNLIDFILTFCNSESIADSDYNAGANSLAAMLTSLGNVSRPGSCIVDSSGKKYPVTCNLLVSGSLSSSIITDTITTSLTKVQNNWNQHLIRLAENKLAHANKQYSEEQFSPAPNQSEEALALLLQQKNSHLLPNKSYAHEWTAVLESPPTPSINGMIAQQKIIVTSNESLDLKKQLTNLHLQSPFIIGSITANTLKESTSNLFLSIMSGTYSAHSTSEVIRGICLMTDPCSLLDTLPKKHSSNTAHIENMIWLVDGNAGPEIERKDYETKKQLKNVATLYHNTMLETLGSRLDHRNLKPSVIEADIQLLQAGWIKFLQRMENVIPGITGVAKNLFASLTFGFAKVFSAHCGGKTIKQLPLEPLQAFAKFIIYRMVNKRSTMYQADNLSLDNKHKLKLIHYLKENPHDVRSLCRRFNKMHAAQCNLLLRGLVEDGLVTLGEDKKWSLTDLGKQSNKDPLLEV